MPRPTNLLPKPIEVVPKPAQQITYAQTMAAIAIGYEKDPDAAFKVFKNLGTFTQDPSSPLYMPYTSPTNSTHINTLSDLGFGSSIIDDNYFEQASFLKSYFRMSGDGTPLAPTKKSPPLEVAAYSYWKLEQDEPKTKQAEKEWQDLQWEIYYKASRNDMNYSDGEIIGSIDWNKYPTLKSMEEGRTTGRPVALNRSVDFSYDAIRGTIWSARNGKTTGSRINDAINYELGKGVTYNDNPMLREMRTPSSPNYNPYKSFTMDQEGMLFGTVGFDPDWAQKNKKYLDDDSTRNAYNNVVEAEKFTAQASKDYVDYYDKVMQAVSMGFEPAKAAELYSKSYTQTLGKMDEARLKGDPVKITRAVPYRYEDVLADAEKLYEKVKKQPSTVEFIQSAQESFGQIPTSLETKLRLDEQVKQSVMGLQPAAIANGTPGEISAWRHAYMPGYDGSIEALQAAVQKAKPEELPKVYAVAMQFSNQYANDNWLDDRKSIDDYNALIEAEEAESGRKRDLARQYIDLYLQINTLSTKASKATDWSMAADLQGQADMLAQQQMDIYNQLDAVKASKLVDYANQLWEDSLEISTARDEKKYRDKRSKINAEIDRLFSPVIPEAQTKKYEDANIRLSNMSHSLSAIQELGLEAGAQSIDSVIPALDYLYFYGSEKPGIDRSSYSDVQVWIQAGNSYEEIAPNIAYRSTKINEDINRIDYLIDFLGDDERYKGYYANLRKERENLVREQTELEINRNFFENRDTFEKEANAYKADPNEGDKIAQMIIDPYEGVGLYSDDRDRNYVNLMTADEQTIYLALKNRDRAESTALADEYWNILSNETNGRLITRNSEEIQETWKELGKDHPLLMGAVMAPMSAFGQIGAVYYSLSSAIQGKDINPYDPAFATTVASGAVKEGANEAITAYYDGKYGEGSFAGQLINTLYQAATAIAESSTTLLMSGGVAAVSLPVMGLNAAAGAIQDAKARNASNEDALLMGAITFMSEVGTELLPVQGMLKAFQEAGAGGVKTLLRGFASQAGEEWLGESINEIINTVSDDLIMREMSNRKQLEQYYILEEDMSPEAAADRANKDMVNNILQAGLVGALSGGSHTLASAGGYVVQKLNAKHLLDQQRQAANVLKTATIPSITVEQQKVINGMSLLDRALSTEDPASQAISLATVLAAESEDRTAPAAAAELLLSKYGKSGLQTVRNILMDGLDNGIPSESVSYAVAIGALLPDSSAGKALDGIMRGGATPAKVNGLVLAAWQEAQNTQSLNRMSAAIVDNVVAKTMIELAGKQGVDQLDKYDQMEIEAKESVAMAQRAFYAAMTQRDAANEVREQANERYLQALAEGSPEEAQKQLFQDLMTAINDFDAANTLADKKAGDLAQADANAKKLIQNTVKAGKALVEQIRAQAMSEVPDISGAIQGWYAGNNATIDPVQADKNVRSALDLLASLDKQAEQDPEIKSSPIYRHAMANLKRSMWDVEKSNAFSAIEQHLEIAQSRKQSQVGTTQSDVGTQLANATVLDQAATWQDSQRQPAEDSFAQAGETLNSISDGLAEVQRTLDALKARQSGGLESPETTQEIDRAEAKLAEIQTLLDRSTPTEQLPGAKAEAEAAEPVGKQAALQTLLDIISPTEQRPGVQPETAESVEKRAKLQTLLDILSPTEQSPGAEPETAGAANKQAALLTLLDTIFPVAQETGAQSAAPDSANKQATIQTLLDTIFPVAQETGAQSAALDSVNKQAAIQTLLDTIAPTEQMPGAEPETAGPVNKQAVLQTLLDVIMPTAQRPGTEPEATRSATKQAALQTQLDTAEPVEQVPGQTPETGTADDRRTRLESQGIEAGAVTQTNAERLASLESRLAETARLAETIQVPAQPAADETRTPAQQTAPKTNKIRPADAKKAASDPANREFISAIKDKTGISIQFSDALPESAEGVYIGSSNTIILNPNTTVLGIVKAVAMHELSHAIEHTSYYAEYADAVLGIEYGKGYANSEQYQRDLDAKIALYKQNGHDLNADMARNEIVAELTRRTVYGTLDDIRAFVSKNPNLAQRILDIVRNIGKQVQRLFGFADDDLTRARTLFENAIREHRKVFPGSESTPTGTGITERVDAPGLRKTAPISPVTQGEGVTLASLADGQKAANIAGNEGAARAGGESVRFNERDSEGNALTPEQAEYFKDSKVRDEQGRLLKVYHGSPKAGFMEFSQGYRPGFFFTDKIGMARSFTENGIIVDTNLVETKQEALDRHDIEGGGIYEVYLNISDPLIIDGKGIDGEASNWDSVNGLSTRQWVEVAIDQGKDGVIFKGITDSGGRGEGYFGAATVAVAFSPEQIKSTTTLAPTADPDIRYSVRDSEYLAAVESGDMAAAQKMVDQAAKQAGYTVKAYHGTTNKIEYADKSKVLSPTEQKAYEDEEQAILAEYEKNAKPYLAEENYHAPEFVEVKNTMAEKLEALYAKYGQRLGYETITIPFALEGNSFDPKKSNDVGTHFASKKETSEIFTYNNGIVFSVYLHGNEVIELDDDIFSRYQQARSALDEFYDKGIIDGNDYDSMLLLAQKADAFETEDERDWGFSAPVRSFWKKLNDILIKNKAPIMSYINMVEGGGESYAVVQPAQIKSADPVTYDDAGNVIPLSQRFDTGKTDIRYAVRDPENPLPSARAILSDAELAVKAAQDALRRKSSELLRGGASNSDIAMQLSALATNLQDAEQEYDDLLAQYGPIPQGEAPFNPEFEVPRKDTLGQNVTRFTRTVGESGVPTEPQYKSIKQAVVEGKLGYQPLSNKTSMAIAAKVLSTGGVQALRSNWEAAIANERIPSKNQIAQGEQLLIEYAKANDGENFLDVMIDLAQAGTRAGQTVQALSMLKRMTAADKLEYANRVLNRVNQDLINKGKTPAEIRPELVDALLKAQGTQAQEEAMDGIIRNIGQQIPPDWKKRVQAWRYLAMLANPKTHIRNVMGNAIFIPVVMLKNQIGAVAEIASGTERTKTFGPVKAEYKNYARELYPTIQKTLASSGKYDSGDALREGMRSFGDSGIGKVLQKLSDFNLNALEAEDRIFLKHHFIQAFGGYLQANNANIGQIDQSMLDKATEHAILEAQKATYRDVSKLANGLSRISESSPAAGLLIEGVMPFKKTPINILKRGVEYSPLGFLKTLLVDSSKIDPDGGQGKITPAQFIDRLSAGLTGTAIAALGASLNALGLLRLGFKKDDKKDEFGKLTGEQEYSIEIEMFGKRYSMTIDWMIPASMPLFVGATLGEIFTAENGGEPLSMDAIFDAAFNIAEPVFNLTMLQGINRGLQGAGYSENPAASFGIRALTNLASQFAPTLAGQITRTIDPVRRTVYTDKNINIPSELQYTIGSLENKLFMSTLNDPYINQWGEEEREDNVVMRILKNFVFPGYINEVERSKTEDELLRIYEESDNAAMIPKMPSKFFTTSGERTDLTSSQYSEVTKTRGRMAKEALDRLLADPTFAFYPTKYQEKMIESIWTYSDITAKRLVREDYTGNWSKTWMDPVANGEIDLVSAVFAEADKGVAEEQKPVYKNQIFDAIDIGGLDGVARADDFIAALESTGMQKSSIKSAITKHYRPLYIEAWKNDSMDVVADIQNTLLMLSGVTYKASDIEGWFLDLEE